MSTALGTRYSVPSMARLLESSGSQCLVRTVCVPVLGGWHPPFSHCRDENRDILLPDLPYMCESLYAHHVGHNITRFSSACDVTR
jgi:hypothetical protein